jgi:cyclic di-GMP phosphodiesterase Gmr
VAQQARDATGQSMIPESLTGRPASRLRDPINQRFGMNKRAGSPRLRGPSFDDRLKRFFASVPYRHTLGRSVCAPWLRRFSAASRARCRVTQMAGLVEQARAARDAGATMDDPPEACPVDATEAQRRLDLLHAVIDMLPVGVQVAGADGRVILANAAAAQIADREAAFPNADGTSVVETAAGPEGARTLLVASRTAQVCGETLRLSGALDITERARAENELLRLAYHDELTGLPNRSLIRERVEAILARGEANARFALAFIDIDNFKHINDFYSHAIGDALLVKFVQRICAHLRASDILARMSGDEFVLILDPLESREQIAAVLDAMVEHLKQPFLIDGFEIFTSASIGVSFYPEHGQDYEALRRNADTAMYRAKADVKGGASFFDLAMGRAVTARMEREQRLRLAIRDRQFYCAFQPKVDIRTHEVIGLEALVRWRDGNGDIQGPSEFVSLAVELGLIDQITHLVLDEAVAAIGDIDEAFGPGTKISINVAAKQATNIGFMRSFAQALENSGRPDRFMVELTEDAFLAKNQFQTEVLPLLRRLGVKVSIDDFGTGYSSLSALADITADEIKIDRSFITDIHNRPRSQNVLKAIESLSAALGMSVVAEGIETFEELAYLQAATRIRYAQGFYFSKPLFLGELGRTEGVATETRAIAAAREQPDNRGSRGRDATPRYASRG